MKWILAIIGAIIVFFVGYEISQKKTPVVPPLVPKGSTGGSMTAPH